MAQQKVDNRRKVENTGITIRPSSALKDLVFLAVFIFIVFALSYFFNLFAFLVAVFQKNAGAFLWIDEIITCLLAFSVGFAVFSWRRWRELKNETANRIKLQEELVRIAETKAETEKIICKQLHCDVEEYKKLIKNAGLHNSKKDRA